MLSTEMGYKVGPWLRESSLLAPSGLGREFTQPRAYLILVPLCEYSKKLTNLTARIRHLIGTGPTDGLGVHRARGLGGRGLRPVQVKCRNVMTFSFKGVHSSHRHRIWKEVWQKFRDLVGGQ